MEKSLTFLVIEDKPADFRLLERHFRQNVPPARCQCVASLEELKAALDQGGWDAVLSDYSVPKLDFRDVLESLQSRHPDLPLILVSGSVGEEQAVELLKLGVWDFVLKDNLARLTSVIERSLREASDRRARRETEAALRDSRTAALSMMEDAVEARDAAERISAELRQEVAERKRAEARAAILAGLGLQLSAARTPAEAAPAIADVGVALFEWDACFLNLYDRQRDTMIGLLNMDTLEGRRTPVPSQAHGRELTPLVRQILAGHAKLLLRDRPDDVGTTVRYGDISRPSMSLMFVPVRHQGECIGVFSVQSYRPQAYTQQDLDALQGLADHCAGALVRLQVEAALTEEAVRRRILFEQSSEGIVVLNENGGVVEANRRYAEMLGYTPEEVLRLHVWDWDTQWNREQLLEMIRRLDDVGSHFETCHRRKDGTVCDVEISNNGVTIAGRKLVFCVCRDISGRKQAEAALRRSEGFTRTVLNNLPVGIAVNSLNPSVFAFMNDNFPRLYRTTREKLTKTDDFWSVAYKDPAFREEVRKRALDDCASGDPARMYWQDIPITRAGQPPAFISARNIPLPEEGLVISTVWDVTPQRQAEAALRASEEQFRAMFELASIGMAQADPQTGRWLRVNQRMCAITGYSTEELLQMRVPEITHPEDRDEDWGAFQRVVRGEAPEYHLEKRYVRKDGSTTWVSVNMTVIRDAAGEPVRTMATIEDISERKRLEDEREVTVQLLGLLNAPTNLRGLMRAVTVLLRERFDCEAVGIRLREGDDFPYFETRGFPAEFVELENCLCQQDASGQPVRDGEGNPVLDMRGNVLCGRFDPAKPFFTARGSFWSGDTTRLLATTTPADRQANTRNRCNGEGYESVALIALRMRSTTLGLVQLNDKRKNRFTPQRIALLERLADSLAIGLAHRQDQDRLRESEALFQSLVENLRQHIFRKDLSGRFTFGNGSFCAAIGKPLAEILGKTDADFFTTELAAKYRRDDLGVLESGQTFQGEEVFQGTDGRKTHISVLKTPLRNAAGQIVGLQGISWDITARKRAEAQAGALGALGLQLGAAHDAAQAAQAIADVGIELFAWDACFLELYDHHTDSVTELLAMDTMDGRRIPTTTTETEDRPSPLLRRILRGRGELMLRTEDESAGTTVRFGDKTRRSRSLMFVPVRHQGESIGVFSMQSYRANAYTPQDLEVLQGLADHCAGTLLRLQTEADLRQSEERHRVLFESALDAIMVLAAPTFKFAKANPATLKTFGVGSEAEFCAFGPADVSPEHQPDGRLSSEAAREMIETALRQGAHTFEWTHRRLSGAEFPALVSLNRIEVAGQLLLQATVRDITVHKQVENELRRRLELQNQLAHVASTVPGAIYSFCLRPDGTMGIPYASEALEGIFGVHPEQVRDDAQPVLALIHPEDAPAVLDSIMVSARAMSPWRVEFRACGTRRGDIWVEGHSVPQLEPDGTILWHGFLHDITERKLAEERVRQLSRAVEQSPAAVVITDPAGDIQYANPKFTALTGYTLDEARGKNPRILKSGETPAEVYRELWNTIRAGGEWRGEFHNRKKNGELFWEFASISPIVDDVGHITHFLAVKEDITERKRLEQERTGMEAQLRQQQKLESIGTLASGVAHEINNPITGIMNYAQLIQDRLPPGHALVEFAGEIVHETQRVATIVRNLLTFARSEKQSHSPARIVDIVESVLSLVRTFIRQDQITLHVNVPADLPQLKCRSQQLQQVIMNLMTNARDALNERYPRHDPDKVMRVEAGLFEKEGRRWIRVTVEDHGTGITPEVRERIFDPFFTTKPRDVGTGLGLSISHGIVKEHHGEWTVESEPGQFTRMHVDLPVDNGWNV